MKFMISQPFAGLSDARIKRVRENAKAKLEAQGHEVIESHANFSDRYLEKSGVRNIDLHYLAAAIMKMATCDAVYFCKGWENARGCVVEHEAAEKYGLEIIEE